MLDIRWAIALLLGPSGCASVEELAALDDQRCVEAFGFAPGTDDYDHCRDVLKARRLQLWRSNH